MKKYKVIADSDKLAQMSLWGIVETDDIIEVDDTVDHHGVFSFKDKNGDTWDIYESDCEEVKASYLLEDAIQKQKFIAHELLVHRNRVNTQMGLMFERKEFEEYEHFRLHLYDDLEEKQKLTFWKHYYILLESQK